MNYCVGYINHGCSVLFNHFRDPYCNKWDNLLTKIIENHDKCVIGDSYYSGKVLTIAFEYRDTCYTIWAANGLYATGHLHSLNGKHVKESLYRRPSFKNQYKLLEMVEDFNNNKLKEEADKFEKGLYDE